MIHQLRAELKKILTVRSTYVILVICFALLLFFAFYIAGYRTNANVTDSGKTVADIVGAVSVLSFLVALVGVLSVTHEYRYNTIMYTLTASNSRLNVLFAKLVVISVFMVLATLFFGALSPLLAAAGANLKGVSLVSQNIPVLDLLWRVAFYGWAYAMYALIFALIIRNQVGTIVALLFLPGTIEGMLGLLLKENNFYLPFSALNSVLNQSPFSHGKAALIVLAYIAVGLVVSILLFKRRDAN